MNLSRVFSVLKAPHLTEKGSSLGDNTYAFKVVFNATKKEIAVAVSKVFAVDVVKVTTVRLKAKRKMFKRRPGLRQAVKKAYVTIAEGQQINLEEAIKK